MAQSDTASVPPTLLEAAKALCCAPHLQPMLWANIRAAIAREDAKPPDFWQSCLDRAQQAEADAKWHLEESARLSAALAEQRSRAEAENDRNRTLSEKLIAAHGREHEERQRAEKAEAEVKRLLQDNAERTKAARKAACDLHRMLEDAGVPGVKLPMTQMSLAERIGWLIGQWKEQPILIDRGSAKGRMASAIAADLDTARDHLQAVVGAAKVACTAMSRAWGLVGTTEQPALDAAQTTLSAAAANARHMVLDRVEPKAPAAAEAPVAPLLDVEWLQSEVERLRMANRDLQEQNWDLQVPDFPPFTPAADHLHYAYVPGDWSSGADEWFVYDRLMRNGHPTRLARVRWRHGPGVPNSDPAQTAMRDQITSLRQELADVHGALSACLRPEVRTGSARGDANRIAKALQVACAQLFRVLPGVNVVERDLPLVVDELLRLRGELAKEKAQFADFAAKVWAGDVEAALGVTRMKREPDPSDPVNLCGPEVAHSRGIVEKAIDEVMAKKLATEPKGGIVRDPVTGWTFDEMRRQFDEARVAVRVLVAELCAARQREAGTRGFEA